MNNYFECTVKFDQMQENGMIKKVSENYLVDAMSFTEAETQMINYIRPFVSGDYRLTSVKRSKISDVVNSKIKDDDLKFFLVKLGVIFMDEKGKEKIIPNYMLIEAKDVNIANENTIDIMKNSICDYKIEFVKETKIIDVVDYSG